MRAALWPDGTRAEHTGDVASFFFEENPATHCLLAVDSNDQPIGFVELSIRSYAEGCDTDRVGYLEGWYVVPAWRQQGIGRALVIASETWARQCGCTEFASDTPLSNRRSRQAHLALGFTEVERVVCFRKRL